MKTGKCFFLLDADDGTTFANQDKYIKCLEKIRKYKPLLDVKH